MSQNLPKRSLWDFLSTISYLRAQTIETSSLPILAAPVQANRVTRVPPWDFRLLGEIPAGVPWVPEVFLACGGNCRCRPKPREKASGMERCFSSSPLTFELFYRITFTPIRLEVSNCDHVDQHEKKCPTTH